MILTAITTLGGILAGLLPDVLSIARNYFDTRSKKEMFELKAKYADTVAKHDLELFKEKSLIDEGTSLRQHDSTLDGGRFINGLRASVRPVLTYLFFAVFLAVKAAQIYLLITTMGGIPIGSLDMQIFITNIMPIVWDQETSAIFGAIVGFWFGSRAIRSKS